MTIEEFLEQHCHPPGLVPRDLPIVLTKGCREYKRYQDKITGYGELKVRGIKWLTHRLAYTLCCGAISKDKPVIMHLCNNPPCCEPEHLKAGTLEENNQYAKLCGRLSSGDQHYSRTRPELLARGDRNGSRCHPERLARGKQHGAYTKPESRRTGEKHGNAKLTDTQVKEIRARCAAGETQRPIAREFGVKQPLISLIVRGEAWKYLLDEQ